MNILIGTVLIGGAAIWLFLHLPNAEWRRASMVASVQMLKFMLPRMVTALLGESEGRLTVLPVVICLSKSTCWYCSLKISRTLLR